MQNEAQQTAAEEISLKDLVNSLKRNRTRIVICGLAGLLLSSFYIALTPKTYEARWELQMAQFSNSNIEEPAALMLRLRGSTAYPVEVQQSCGITEDLDGIPKIVAIKNVANVVEMKVRASTPEQAMKCAVAIVAMTVAQQRSLIEERLAGRQNQLVQYQQALLREELQQLEKIKKSELGNFGYLAQLDKLSWLRTRIDALQEEALLSRLHPAKLIAPIYSPKKPVSRKVGLVLLLGVMLGLMLGVLYAFGREGWRRTA